MIQKLSVNNLGPIASIQCNTLGKINLFVGENGTGKTYLLKFIYAIIKCTEQFQRGIERRSLNQLLSDKLFNVFLLSELGELVKKGTSELSTEIKMDAGATLAFSFGISTKQQIQNLHSTIPATNTNSIFIPAKEILSLQNVIIRSRGEMFNEKGFDDTYLDLANALMPSYKGRNYEAFSNVRKNLAEALNGRIEFDDTKKEWIFKDSQRRIYNISVTAEGIKKLSVLGALLGNHYLSNQSTIFIDEIENALHPALISKFIEMVYQLAKAGIQFFISTHSYAVIKKLYIIAQREKQAIPVFSLEKEKVQYGNLAEDMLDNAIIRESIKLYEEEIEL